MYSIYIYNVSGIWSVYLLSYCLHIVLSLAYYAKETRVTHDDVGLKAQRCYYVHWTADSWLLEVACLNQIQTYTPEI